MCIRDRCRNRPERSDVHGNSRAGIADRFCLEFAFLYLKIVRQLGGVAGKPSDAAIGVMKHDEVKLPAASRNAVSYTHLDVYKRQP